MNRHLRHLSCLVLLLPLAAQAASGAPPGVSAATAAGAVASAVHSPALEGSDGDSHTRPPRSLATLGLAALVAAAFLSRRRRPD